MHPNRERAMKELKAGNVAILVEGLPENMRDEKTAYAIETYVKTRLVVYEGRKLLPCIGFMLGAEEGKLFIYVMGDESESLRRAIAVYTNELLHRVFSDKGLPFPSCEYKL